jgi:hypothetical protein
VLPVSGTQTILRLQYCQYTVIPYKEIGVWKEWPRECRSATCRGPHTERGSVKGSTSEGGLGRGPGGEHTEAQGTCRGGAAEGECTQKRGRGGKAERAEATVKVGWACRDEDTLETGVGRCDEPALEKMHLIACRTVYPSD